MFHLFLDTFILKYLWNQRSQKSRLYGKIILWYQSIVDMIGKTFAQINMKSQGFKCDQSVWKSFTPLFTLMTLKLALMVTDLSNPFHALKYINWALIWAIGHSWDFFSTLAIEGFINLCWWCYPKIVQFLLEFFQGPTTCSLNSVTVGWDRMLKFSGLIHLSFIFHWKVMNWLKIII